MSDTPDPANGPADLPAVPPAAAPVKPKKKRRTWGQRLKLLLLVLLIGAGLFRILLNGLLPTVINRVAGLYDLEVGYDRLGLSLLGGTANLYGLKIRPAGGGDSILQSDYVQGDLSAFNLLRGRLVVYRAEVDGVILAIDREADGSIPLLNRFLAAKQGQTPAVTSATTQPVTPISLDAPLRIDAVRLSQVTVKLRDKSVTPVFEAVVLTTLRVSDIGAPGEPTRVELDVRVDPLIDTLRVSGTAHTSPDELKADVKLLLRGVHPKAAAGYLAQLGLRPVAEDVTVEADLSLSARTIPNSADFTADVSVTNVKAVADGAQWASLESLRLDAKRLSAAGVELGTVSLKNGTATARRTAGGRVDVAGLAIVPGDAVPATAPPATRPTPAVAAVPQASVGAAAPPFYFSLNALDVRNLQATVTDESVSPAAEFVARLDSFTLAGVNTDAASAGRMVPVSAVVALPGLARSVTVKGTVLPFAATKTAELAVAADGVRPDVLRPYLARLGVQSQLNDARLDADVYASVESLPDGTTVASAGMKRLNFTDGDTTLVDLAAADIDGLAYTPADGAVAVRAINVTGPGLTIVRDAEGRLGTAGFRLVPPDAGPLQTAMPTSDTGHATTQPTTRPTTRPVAPPALATPPALAALPRVQIDRLKWGGAKLTLRDESAATPSTFVFDDAGLDVQDLLLDLGSGRAGKPGRFVAWLAAPGVADTLTASGTFAPGPNRLTVTADVNGEGLNGEKLTPYTTPLGVVPTLVAGKLAAKASATLTQSPAGLGLNLEAHDVSYADGPTELVGVDSFGMNGLVVSAARVDVDSMYLVRPRARVVRDADGTFRAAGVHVVGVPAAPTGPTPTYTTAPATLPVGPVLSALPVELGIKALRIIDASIDWADAAAASPVELHAGASIAMDNIDIAPTGGPATLRMTARVDDALTIADVRGTLGLSPIAPSMNLKITADGVRAGPLAAYLPPTFESTLRAGRFAATVDAGVSNHPDGGVAAHIRTRQLTWADGDTTFAKVDAFTLAAARLDPVANVFAFDELSSRGVAATLSQSPDGLALLGLRTRVAPPTTQAAAPAAPTIAPAAAPVASLAAMVGDSRRPLPLLTLEKFDLGVERLTLAGFTGPDAAPVDVRDLSITTPGPIRFGGAEPERAGPLYVSVGGAVDPLVGRFDVGLKLTPFAVEPAVAIDVTATGIKGDGLTKLLPALKPRIDGAGLTDGTFTTHVDASISYGRRGPRDLDIGRGFVARFDVKPLEMRATPDGPVLIGVQSVHGEGIKVEPKTGNVAVKLLEVSTPIARAHRDDRGLHAAGLVLLLGAQETPETLTAPPPTAPEEPVATPVADAAPTPRPENELRLDRFTVSGVDVVIEDRTSQPFTVIPLKTLDVDVQGLSNQLPWSGKPVRFSLLCTADKVALPPRKGAIGEATTQPVDGAGYTEQRELFSQVTASGRVGFVRNGDTLALDGWAKTAVNGFELLGVRGLVQPYGVTVGGGVFDDTNDIRFNPAGTIETRNRIVFTNLSLSEPADGPLRKLLKLPAPIDVAIGAVTDPDGSITLNLPVPIKNGAIKPGDVVGPALGAVTNVLLTGIASAPMKAVGGIGQLIGLGGKDAAAPEPPVVIQFLPAYAGLDAAARTELARLGEELNKDDTLELQLRHTLTDADAARTAVRANPPVQTALALAERVRQQKVDLQARFAALAAQARGDFGAGSAAQAGEATDGLRELGRQITQAEKSLDDLYALTTPGAAAQADRRTRTAGLDIARQRLEAAKRAITDVAGRRAGTRVSAANPQFDPVPSGEGGDVTVVLVRKKT